MAMGRRISAEVPKAIMSEEDICIELDEYESIVSTCLTEQQACLLEEQFGRYLGVKRELNGGYRLCASQHVGVIVLDGIRIFIRPKVPLDNLFYMLTFADDLPIFRPEQADLDEATDLFEFFVEIFTLQVDRLLRQGILRAYVDHDANERYLRGRLLIADHLRHNIAAPHRLYQRRSDYTADVLENQILRHTLQILSRQFSLRDAQRNQIRKTLSAFSDVTPAHVGVDDCDRIVYTRLNERYRMPISLARLIMQHLSLEGRSGPHRFFAFLFDMNQVFEQFVAELLDRRLADPHSVKIQQSVWMDVGQSEKGMPDLILCRGSQRIMVMDTKYKTFYGAPDGDDRNQMVTYCHTMGVRPGLLIYADARKVEYERQFGDVALRAVSLRLDGSLPCFQKRCQGFVDDLLAVAIEQYPMAK